VGLVLVSLERLATIGIDEAHEMCINKECKQYVTRPSAAKMSNTATYLTIRAKAMKKSAAFPEKKADLCIITTLYAKDKRIKLEMNVKCQIKHLQANSNLERTKRELLHLFKNKRPTPEHLLTFRIVGKREFESTTYY
jgi:hypothetical protein